ncbi:MAG TPA: choice-of-anchor P family protein [Spirillospora sp.]
MRYRHVARRLTTAGVLAAGLAAAATPALATAPQDGSGGSAYGLAVSGPVDVPPVPSVSSTAGTVGKSLLRENRTKLVRASVLDVTAAADRARATVAKAAVPAVKLSADAIAAKCDGGLGSAHLTRAVVAGRHLDSTPPPNTSVPVDVEGVGRAALTLNKQQRTADGRLAVTGLELTLPVPGGEPATVRLASATCGKASGPAEPPADAPAPTPVEHDLPVTG